MSAFIVLLFAMFSRVLPLMFHSAGLNLSATSGSLLFFGSRRPRWQAIFAIAIIAMTDVLLSVYLYPRMIGYQGGFHLRGYLLTWAWYGVVCMIGSGLLRRVTALRVVAGVLTSAVGFYILSDLPVWAFGTQYAHTSAGLVQCYVAALPFLWNDLVSTSIVAGVLFGIPALAARMSESASANQMQA